jgi:hypothetical protein
VQHTHGLTPFHHRLGAALTPPAGRIIIRTAIQTRMRNTPNQLARVAPQRGFSFMVVRGPHDWGERRLMSKEVIYVVLAMLFAAVIYYSFNSYN